MEPSKPVIEAGGKRRFRRQIGGGKAAAFEGTLAPPGAVFH